MIAVLLQYCCSQPAFNWEEYSVCRKLCLSYNVLYVRNVQRKLGKGITGGKTWLQSHVLKKFGKYHCISIPTEVLQKMFLEKTCRMFATNMWWTYLDQGN